MSSSPKIVIFAQARTGSTTLTAALSCHSEVRIAQDVFAKGFSQWFPGERDYSSVAKDVDSLNESLIDIFSKYSGFKTLSHELTEDLNSYLLLNEEHRVIYLRRRNHLQAVVSCEIAEQTKVWQIGDYQKFDGDRYKDLNAIPIEKLKAALDYHAYLDSFYEKVLNGRASGSFLTLFYEDLYRDDLDEGRRAIGAVFDFLSLETPYGEELDFHLSPRKSKINSLETYRAVPNIDEINAALGSKENGYLF